MLITRIDVFDVPFVLGTILNDREASNYQRTFYFRNLSSVKTLTIRIEESTDGGGTWTIVGTSFNLGVSGSGSEVAVKNLSSVNILRVRGSGGGDDRDLYLALCSFALDADRTWANPLI